MKFIPIALSAALFSLCAIPFANAKEPAKELAGEPSVHSYVLLDRTGSMSDIWSEALSSVNAYAEGLGALDDGKTIDTDITLAVFDSQDGLQFDVIRDNATPGTWRKVTSADASPRGMTPLYDAIGRIVAMAEQDAPSKAVIVIMTDGRENSSKETTRDGAKAALERARAKGWEVVFLGAEFSNFDDAEGVGQSKSRNMAVAKEQLSQTMGTLAQKSRDYAAGASATVEFNDQDRSEAKEEDVKQRTNR